MEVDPVGRSSRRVEDRWEEVVASFVKVARLLEAAHNVVEVGVVHRIDRFCRHRLLRSHHGSHWDLVAWASTLVEAVVLVGPHTDPVPSHQDLDIVDMALGAPCCSILTGVNYVCSREERAE